MCMCPNLKTQLASCYQPRLPVPPAPSWHSVSLSVCPLHVSLQEIVDWFNALRAARLQYLKMAFPELPESEVS